MTVLNFYSLTLAHGDQPGTNNPALRYVDWGRKQLAIPVKNPRAQGLQIPAGGEALVFDDSRSTSIDGTTTFDLTLSPIDPSRYRLTHSGGTAPGFRTDRDLDLTGIVLTLTAQANGTLVVEAGASVFSVLQVGDEVMIPGLVTGDGTSGPFGFANEGLWTVLGQNGTSVTLARPSGQSFEGMSATVTPTSAADFFAYSPDGVQIEDKAEIGAGFSAPTRKTFQLAAVTSRWIEIVSTTPLVAQAGVAPGAVGLKFYGSMKRFLQIEADQDCVLRLNGDTGSAVRLSPWAAGDEALVAPFVHTGPVWSLRVVNKSPTLLKLTVISAE